MKKQQQAKALQKTIENFSGYIKYADHTQPATLNLIIDDELNEDEIDYIETLVKNYDSFEIFKNDDDVFLSISQLNELLSDLKIEYANIILESKKIFKAFSTNEKEMVDVSVKHQVPVEFETIDADLNIDLTKKMCKTHFNSTELNREVKKGRNFNNFLHNKKGEGTYIIDIEKKFKYNILIEIAPDHKNYQTLKNIGYFLKTTNNSWRWLIEKANIHERTMKSYFSGRDYITLKTIEKIVFAFDGIIKSPRKIMNLDYPVLKGGDDFKLNICEIMTKYRINRGDLSIGTGIDNGTISNYFNGVQKQIRIETLIKFFNYFKTRGVPLKNKADLIYFPSHGETALHFILNVKDKNYIP